MKKIIRENCVLRGKFALSSGMMSNKYFDLRKATLNGNFLDCLAHYIKIHIFWKYSDINIIGGPTIGADFITAGILALSKIMGFKIQGSIVRKPKEYGTGAVIENLITQGKRNILVVDDVLTTGGSIEKACNEFLKAGYSLKVIFVILDRSDGAAAKMLENKFKVPVFSIFKELDFNEN